MGDRRMTRAELEARVEELEELLDEIGSLASEEDETEEGGDEGG